MSNLERDLEFFEYQDEESVCHKCGHKQLDSAGEYCKQCGAYLMETEDAE